ncbi:hypothetical protein CHS0354_026509 [Potamilus streckersoni]|uniref:Uncharacterized protein n=1 Tax=Potamilus streckersoni TaxID=2493646 RepID=A0AAE0RQ20_9BIVA|nr:hypothetical protein CHS0354_026509 [Potamilus streckersoni]
MNISSCGPSSADCVSPILLISQTYSLLSMPLHARIVLLWGDHLTWKVSSLCALNKTTFNFTFLRSTPRDNSLIGRSSDQNKLVIRIKGRAVDLSSVGIIIETWLAGVSRAGVPDHKFLVIRDRSKHTCVKWGVKKEKKKKEENTMSESGEKENETEKDESKEVKISETKTEMDTNNEKDTVNDDETETDKTNENDTEMDKMENENTDTNENLTPKE